jgi:hypothetical protein
VQQSLYSLSYIYKEGGILWCYTLFLLRNWHGRF